MLGSNPSALGSNPSSRAYAKLSCMADSRRYAAFIEQMSDEDKLALASAEQRFRDLLDSLARPLPFVDVPKPRRNYGESHRHRCP